MHIDGLFAFIFRLVINFPPPIPSSSSTLVENRDTQIDRQFMCTTHAHKTPNHARRMHARDEAEDGRERRKHKTCSGEGFHVHFQTEDMASPVETGVGAT